jgi:hypothetical protein
VPKTDRQPAEPASQQKDSIKTGRGKRQSRKLERQRHLNILSTNKRTAVGSKRAATFAMEKSTYKRTASSLRSRPSCSLPLWRHCSEDAPCAERCQGRDKVQIQAVVSSKDNLALPKERAFNFGSPRVPPQVTKSSSLAPVDIAALRRRLH